MTATGLKLQQGYKYDRHVLQTTHGAHSREGCRYFKTTVTDVRAEHRQWLVLHCAKRRQRFREGFGTARMAWVSGIRKLVKCLGAH